MRTRYAKWLSICSSYCKFDNLFVQSGAVVIIHSFSFVVFCLLFLFACVVLPHYVVNKDEYNYIGFACSH